MQQLDGLFLSEAALKILAITSYACVFRLASLKNSLGLVVTLFMSYYLTINN